MDDLQARAEGAQDKHGLRSNPRPCVLCGQPVVWVCDDPDMGGNGVTCHYEPATEDEKAKRIAELEAKLATLHSRLEFTSCQKADVEAQVLELEEQNAALRQDAAVGRAIEKLGDTAFADLTCSMWDASQYRWGLKVATKDDPTLTRFYYGDTLYAALEAAGLMEEAE